MPYINLKANVPISDAEEKRIKEFFGMCISLIPNKSENWLMVDIEGGKNLYFKGDKITPAVFVDFKVFGNMDKSMCKKVTEIATKNISEILHVNPMNIYICYMTTQNWGWSSQML